MSCRIRCANIMTSVLPELISKYILAKPVRLHRVRGLLGVSLGMENTGPDILLIESP